MRTSEVERLLDDLGSRKLSTKSKQNATWVNGCCPIHNESNPSFGVWAEEEIYNCYVCGSGSLVNLVMQVKNYTYRQALTFLEDYGGRGEEEYSASYNILKGIGKYADDDEFEEEEHFVPRKKLALYRSGNVYHKYLKERGFSREVCKKFMIGWDADNCRITIPVFDRQDNLYGLIRRAVLNPKLSNGEENAEYKSLYGNQPKYYIDDTIPKSKVLWPLPHFTLPADGTIIIVEGQIDAMRMHIHGFTNTLSIINAKINEDQVALLEALGVKRIIKMLDDDAAGAAGSERIDKMLKQYHRYSVVYPEGKYDPDSLTAVEAREMIKNMKSCLFSTLKRR